MAIQTYIRTNKKRPHEHYESVGIDESQIIRQLADNLIVSIFYTEKTPDVPENVDGDEYLSINVVSEDVSALFAEEHVTTDYDPENPGDAFTLPYISDIAPFLSL